MIRAGLVLMCVAMAGCRAAQPDPRSSMLAALSERSVDTPMRPMGRLPEGYEVRAWRVPPTFSFPIPRRPLPESHPRREGASLGLLRMIEGVLTFAVNGPRGRVDLDVVCNVLMVADIPEVLDLVERILGGLWTATAGALPKDGVRVDLDADAEIAPFLAAFRTWCADPGS